MIGGADDVAGDAEERGAAAALPRAWERLGFSRSVFFREIRRGRIPVLTTPAGPRVKASDLEAYVEMIERESREARQAS
jgi:hypothetical protein